MGSAKGKSARSRKGTQAPAGRRTFVVAHRPLRHISVDGFPMAPAPSRPAPTGAGDDVSGFAFLGPVTVQEGNFQPPNILWYSPVRAPLLGVSRLRPKG